MNPSRILCVDDEPDIRAFVEFSLRLDTTLAVRSCSSGLDALATAVNWSPDVILCDVLMPVLDGPTTLARLRECPQTANIPVVFMAAGAQTREIEYYKSIGAAGMIVKPFDPMTLADTVRCHLWSADFASICDGFVRRMRADAASLAECRADLRNESPSPQALEQIKLFAHALAGAAGIFGFQEVGYAASILEATTIDQLAGRDTFEEVKDDLDALQVAVREAIEQKDGHDLAILRRSFRLPGRAFATPHFRTQ